MRARDVTPRQLACFRAILTTGTPKAAADELGISPLTLRNHLAEARIRLGVETNEQAVYLLARRGSLSVGHAQGTSTKQPVLLSG